MTDRRRVNGPASGTAQLIFDPDLVGSFSSNRQKPTRTRAARELRKIYLQAGVTPSASGSSYLELEQPSTNSRGLSRPSTLKLLCNVHGPKPLSKSTPFTSNMLLTTTIKFAPFATSRRRGYLRDNAERDLAVHLETALRGVILSNRLPKSGLDVVITILEGEDDSWWSTGSQAASIQGSMPFGLMSVLAGCITAASTAIINAGIDCVDVAAGGVAALVKKSSHTKQDLELVLDPCPSEHEEIVACCVVGYLKARDEITELWMRGGIPLSAPIDATGQTDVDAIINGAIQAASAAHTVVISSLNDVLSM